METVVASGNGRVGASVSSSDGVRAESRVVTLLIMRKLGRPSFGGAVRSSIERRRVCRQGDHVEPNL